MSGRSTLNMEAISSICGVLVLLRGRPLSDSTTDDDDEHEEKTIRASCWAIRAISLFCLANIDALDMFCMLAEIAELRSAAGDSVTKFVESFPPLARGWRPVTESKVRIELCEGRLVLQGRVDLTLGSADGLRSGKVLVDLKTGGFSPDHTPDLRFYALLETLRLGTPPSVLASYYLDSGRAQHERVTEGVLDAAVARTIAATERVVELRHGGVAPTQRTGPRCRWCAIASSCTEGQAYLTGADVDADDLDDLDLVDELAL
jgi:hypothetical protein